MKQFKFKNFRKPFGLIMIIVLLFAMAPQVSFYANANQTPDNQQVDLLEVFEESDIPTVSMEDVREANVNSAIPTTITASKYDPRDTDYCTSVKDQQDTGLCWDFALNAAAELSLIASGQETKALDLSEYYVAAHIARLSSDYRDQVNGGDYGLDAESVRDFIGEDFLPLSLESKFPYSRLENGLSLTNEEDKDYDYEIDRVSYMDNYAPDEEKRKLIKQSIVDYGGVFAAVNGSDISSVSEEENEYACYSTRLFVNHAVTIVGWDDDYSASNFKTEPKGNGAWLVKNSYGYELMDGGMYGSYHWMSYYQDNGNRDARMAFHVVKKGQSTKTYAHKDVELYKDSTMKVSDFWGVDSYVKDPIYSDKTYQELTWDTYGTKEYNVYDKSGNKLGTMTVKCVGDINSFHHESEISYSTEENGVITINLPHYTTFPAGIGSIRFLVNGNVIKDIQYSATPDDVITVDNKMDYLNLVAKKCGTVDVTFSYQDAKETSGKECKEVLHFVIEKDDSPTTTTEATTTQVTTTEAKTTQTSSEAGAQNTSRDEYSTDIGNHTDSKGSSSTVARYKYYDKNGITYQVPCNEKNAKVYSVYKNKKTLKVEATIAGCKVTTIGAKAFEKCTANKIVLGKNITTINAKAFKNAKLKKLEIKSTKLRTVSESAFDGVKKVTLKVPNKKFKEYKKLFKKVNRKIKVVK